MKGGWEYFYTLLRWQWVSAHLSYLAPAPSVSGQGAGSDVARHVRDTNPRPRAQRLVCVPCQELEGAVGV
jgi:hypothetical protein